MRNNNLLTAWLLLGFLAVTSTILSAQNWQTITPLNIPRFGAAAVVLDGYIYVMGGETANGAILNSVERYDPQTGEWDNNTVTPFSLERLDAAAVVFDNKIYLTGGWTQNDGTIKKVEVYDPQQNSWGLIEEMKKDRRGHKAVILNEKVCVMGGIRDNGSYPSKIEWYDDEHDKWEDSSTPIYEPRIYPYTAAVDDTVFLFGGIFNVPFNTSFRGYVDSQWAFNWSNGPSLQFARGNGADAILGDSLFIMGGITGAGTSTDLVEIYNLKLQQVEPGPTLSSPRIGMSSVNLDGILYLIGGYNITINNPLNLVEVYDPLVALEPPDNPYIPLNFTQIKGYPNPFNGIIQLEIRLPEKGINELTIYDITGKKIRTLYRGFLTSGTHIFTWNGLTDFNLQTASGVYFAVLNGKRYQEKFKVFYIK